MAKADRDVASLLRRYPSLYGMVQRLREVKMPKAGEPVNAEQPDLIPPDPAEGRRPRKRTR